MKKSIISLAIAASLIASMPAQAGDKVKVKWFGFAQITAAQGDGLDPDTLDPDTGETISGLATDPTFGADRVRFGFKIKDGNIFGKLQADLNRKHESTATKNGTLPEIIKDIEVGYKFSDAAKLKFGQFKTPVGMDFNTSGKKLDLTKRGMEKQLVLERAVGVMLSGRKIAGGFGYDLFFGNPAGRGVATAGGTTGDTNSMAARVMYDMGKMMHVELGYGIDEMASTNTSPNADDYEVLDFGFRMKMAAMTIKAEYIAGSNVKGAKNIDETVWYGHFGYSLGRTTELLIRHYQADIDNGIGDSASMTNTYLGANFYLGSNKTNGRIQVNYVIAGGDNSRTGDTQYPSTGDGSAAAKGAFFDDVLLAQYQVSF